MKIVTLLREWNDERKGDRILNIKTMGRDESSSDDDHHPYEPTPYSVLERLADSGHIGSENTLVDYGCGKGRTAFFLSHRTGCRTIGVECDRAFFQDAEKNRRRVVSGVQAKFLLQNAECCPVPEDADRFYFFNPFSVEILKLVLERIREAYDAAPRRMLLFFYYPSEKYVAYLRSEDALSPLEDLDCRDLFPDDDARERVLVYEFTGERKIIYNNMARKEYPIKGGDL